MLEICKAITNLDRTFAEADTAYHDMLQLTPSELAKRDIFSVTYPADRAVNSAALHRLIVCGTPFWIRKRYIRDDGSLVWVLNHVTRLVGLTGVTRIAASSFVLPPELLAHESSDVVPNGLAEQTKLLQALFV